MDAAKVLLLIRADASLQIGSGHVMRCLALAQAWQEAGGSALFVMALDAPAVAARLTAEGMELTRISARPGSAEDARQTADIALQRKAAWVMLDGYHFDSDYQRMIKDAGSPLLFVDDYGHTRHYYADVVLNQNIYADESLYPNRESYTRLLLGTRYVLLRREFWRWRGWQRETMPVARKVLVTLGGSDPDNVTLKVIRGLQHAQLTSMESVVLIGAFNARHAELQSMLTEAQPSVRLERTVADMSELMAWADVAISAGGSTCWELAFMGLPGIVLVLARNQQKTAEELDKGGIVLNLGLPDQVAPAQIAQAICHLSVLADARAEMSQRGCELVDGEGVDRVLSQVRDQKIRLRRIREADGQLLWEWANDPEVRAVSFFPEPIPWEHHLKWFGSKLADPDCFFYIALDDHDKPIGQVRYDVNGDEAVLSISLDARYRGRGYGAVIVKLASQRLYQVSATKHIYAYVKASNDASINMFRKAGFKHMGMTMMRGQQAARLVLSKELAA